jgi:hypothetical protein
MGPGPGGRGTPESDEGEREPGLDLKFAPTSNLALDVALNPDFAQVEADDERVNLTRFPLFFPERRPFFQDRASVFQLPLGGTDRLFHSRRIGLAGSSGPDLRGGASGGPRRRMGRGTPEHADRGFGGRPRRESGGGPGPSADPEPGLRGRVHGHHREFGGRPPPPDLGERCPSPPLSPGLPDPGLGGVPGAGAGQHQLGSGPSPESGGNGGGSTAWVTTWRSRGWERPSIRHWGSWPDRAPPACGASCPTDGGPARPPASWVTSPPWTGPSTGGAGEGWRAPGGARGGRWRPSPGTR